MRTAIFVFTGTGNSLQIAKAVAERRKSEIFMLPGSEETDISDYDDIGFVFPVHYYQPPHTVVDAVGRLEFSKDQKVWAVMDYGTTPGDAVRKTFGLLETTDADVLFCRGYRMPENYIMMFDSPSEDECASMLEKVPGYADEVCSLLENRTHEEPVSKLSGRMISSLGGPFYDRWRNTSKFSVTDGCTTCGLCEMICPANAIVMNDSRPEWVKDKCLHCAGCINRCPSQAIEYGKGSVGRKRYVNPALLSKESSR